MSTYTNFLSSQLSPSGTVGKKAWDWGKQQGYTDQQLKVGVQQLLQSGVGINNAPGQFFQDGGPMRGVPGIASPKNPLGKYQGKGGNLGISSYNKARGEFSASEISQHLGASGMFLPSRAQAQYNTDIQNENMMSMLEQQRLQMEQQNAAMRDQMSSMLSMYEQKNNTISKAAPYSVGTGGNTSLKSASSKGSKKSSVRKTWGRGGAGFQSSLNAGATGSASAGSATSKSLNV